MAAAVTLVSAGQSVTLIESRKRLGGRASSFVDQESGETVDNCQHVAMGCCTAFLEFCRTTGLSDQLRRERQLTFLAPRHRPCTFTSAPLPAPFHLAPAFARIPYLSWSEKFAFGRAAAALAWSHPKTLQGRNFLTWLQDHGQTERLIRRVWEVLLVSALSESMDRIDASYARKVLVDGFLTNRTGWEVYVPRIPLDALFTDRVLPWLSERGAHIEMGTAVERLEFDGNRVLGVQLRDGRLINADQVIVTVPWHRLGQLLGPELLHSCQIPDSTQLQSAPITSVHLWLDQPLMPQRSVVLVERLCQWVFLHPEQPGQSGAAQQVWRYQVVISASRMLKGVSREETVARVWHELRDTFPEAANASLQHARVVTEHRAVYSPLPGVDAYRPSQKTAVANLFLAGDWTQTGWPATMESAVLSGNRAAQLICES